MKRLPLGLAVGAVVVPVGAPASAVSVQIDVRHHHDHGPAGGRLLGRTQRGPVGGVAAGAVQQIQHRVVLVAVLRVAARQQDANVDRTAQRGGRDRERHQATVERMDGGHVEAVGVAKVRG